jgi:hypothetical protein
VWQLLFFGRAALQSNHKCRKISAALVAEELIGFSHSPKGGKGFGTTCQLQSIANSG